MRVSCLFGCVCFIWDLEKENSYKMKLYSCVQFWDRCCMLSCCSHWKANVNIATAVLNAVTNLRCSVTYCLRFYAAKHVIFHWKEHLLQVYFRTLQGVAKHIWQMDCYLQYCEEFCKKILIMFSVSLVRKKSCGKKCPCILFVYFIAPLYACTYVYLWGPPHSFSSPLIAD